MDLSERALRKLQEAGEFGRTKSVEPFRRVAAGRRNRIADLIAVFEILRSGSGVRKCQGLVPKFVCELPNHQVLDVIDADARSARIFHSVEPRTKNQDPGTENREPRTSRVLFRA